MPVRSAGSSQCVYVCRRGPVRSVMSVDGTMCLGGSSFGNCVSTARVGAVSKADSRSSFGKKSARGGQSNEFAVAHMVVRFEPLNDLDPVPVRIADEEA